jgi:hypothetical protein
VIGSSCLSACRISATVVALVKHYAKLDPIDAEQAHRRASPADHWLR